ncbi:hypothetical protein [Streptomyces atratus]
MTVVEQGHEARSVTGVTRQLTADETELQDCTHETVTREAFYDD